MDPDTLASQGVPLEPPDVYVTTWIGTKPEIRPDVRLVAVLDADAMIRRPDLRAAERGFHDLSELARWAGPASAGGRLLIQTGEPNHPAIQAVVRGEPRFFLEREIEARRDPPYPPFTELLRVSGPSAAVQAAAVRAREEGAMVLGPVAARGMDPEEREFLAKARDSGALAASLRPLFASSEGAGLRIDADPR
jgi:primosomal protein N' (replication factor Y)